MNKKKFFPRLTFHLAHLYVSALIAYNTILRHFWLIVPFMTLILLPGLCFYYTNFITDYAYQQYYIFPPVETDIFSDALCYRKTDVAAQLALQKQEAKQFDQQKQTFSELLRYKELLREQQDKLTSSLQTIEQQKLALHKCRLSKALCEHSMSRPMVDVYKLPPLPIPPRYKPRPETLWEDLLEPNLSAVDLLLMLGGSAIFLNLLVFLFGK